MRHAIKFQTKQLDSMTKARSLPQQKDILKESCQDHGLKTPYGTNWICPNFHKVRVHYVANGVISGSPGFTLQHAMFAAVARFG